MAFGDADASTPPFVKASVAGRTVTTASFTPPAGAVLAAFAWHDTAGGNLTNTSVITDSQGLAWTIRYTVSKQSDGATFANAHIQLSTATVASSVAMTVTTTGTNTNNPCGLYVRVMTGVDTANPIDVTPTEGFVVNGAATANQTTVTDGSRTFFQFIDWNVAAAPTYVAGMTAVVTDTIGASDDRIGLAVQNAVKTPAGLVTSGTTAPTTGNTYNYAAVTFRPASGPAPQNLTGTGIASGEAFGSGTVTPGAVTLSGTGIASAEAFGVGAVTSVRNLAGTGIASAEAFGAGTVSPGAVTLTGSGIASGAAFGAGTVTPGAVSLAGSGIASAEAFGAGTVSPGAVTVTGAGIASGETFGSGTVTPGGVTVTGSGIPSGAAFGTGVVSAGGTVIGGAGIGSGEAFGAGSVAPGPVTVTGAGIPSGLAFGSGTVSSAGPATQTLTGTGIGSGETFGAGAVGTGPVQVTGVGIPSGEAFGVGTVGDFVPPEHQFIVGTNSSGSQGGIPSREEFGNGRVTKLGRGFCRPCDDDLEFLVQFGRGRVGAS